MENKNKSKLEKWFPNFYKIGGWKPQEIIVTVILVFMAFVLLVKLFGG